MFLSAKNNISNLDELKTAINALRHTVDLNQKKRDFQHLLIREENAERILQFWEYVEGL